MINSVLLFGASVTQQGGEAGFHSHLKSLLSSISIQLDTKGFGGCHFDDAGFYLLSSCLKRQHQLVLLDWNSTYRGLFTEWKLLSFIDSILKNNSFPVFLILPTYKNCINRQSEDSVFELKAKGLVDVIDLRGLRELGEILRDEYHTNIDGARFYASAIYDFIQHLNYDSSIKHAQEVAAEYILAEAKQIVATNFEYRQDIGQGESLCIRLKSKLREASCPHDLCIGTIIGPYSGFLDIYVNSCKTQRIQIWDEWCHYERFKIFRIFDEGFEFKNGSDIIEIRLHVPNARPDYSKCRRQEFSYDDAIYMKIDNIYTANLTAEEFKLTSQPSS